MQIPSLRCIKHNLSDINKRINQGIEVELNICDKNEIEKANNTFTSTCEISCKYFIWKQFDSEVCFNFLTKYFFNFFFKSWTFNT